MKENLGPQFFHITLYNDTESVKKNFEPIFLGFGAEKSILTYFTPMLHLYSPWFSDVFSGVGVGSHKQNMKVCNHFLILSLNKYNLETPQTQKHIHVEEYRGHCDQTNLKKFFAVIVNG